MSKQTIILDFDGVIHSYKSGWQGSAEIITDPPVDNVNQAIQELRKNYRVVVLSSRCHQKGGIQAIKEWLKEYNIEVDDVVRDKVPAVVHVDDRAITFNGVWDENMISKIKEFEPWTKR
jgi:5'(3')-deoxyribonucleotidase